MADCPAFEGHGVLSLVTNVDDPEESVLTGFFDVETGEEYSMVVNLVRGPNMSKMDGAHIMRPGSDASIERIERLSRLTVVVETLCTSEDEHGVRIPGIQLEGGRGDGLKWSSGDVWDIRGPSAQ